MKKIFSVVCFGSILFLAGELFAQIPQISGAKAVGKSTCATCHTDTASDFQTTKHGKAGKECESCHGSGSLHVDGGGDTTKIVNPAKVGTKTASQICLDCHSGDKINWTGSQHALSDLSCLSCHQPHQPASEKKLLQKKDEVTLCVSCHTGKKAKLEQSSHMPIREGKLTCSSCHNPHGSSGKKMLNTTTVNENCYSCHPEKRGPLLWEHPPVRENCNNCHDSHGANNSALLARKMPFLCFSCHSYGGHINVPRYNRASASWGESCINCHNRIHGSNHPSGAKLTR